MAAMSRHLPSPHWRARKIARVLAAGFDGYIAKPVNPVELIDAVAAAAAAGAVNT